MDIQEIRKLGISSSAGDKQTHELFDRLVAMGWIDGAGRPLPWTAHQKKRRESARDRD